MKILVVDDHPLFCQGIGYVLRAMRQGITIIEAHDGAAALAALRAHPDVELAIVDLKLPDLDGVELTRRLHALRRGFPVVLISGSESEADARRALAAGAIAYVPKSANGRSMAEALRSALGGRTSSSRGFDAGAPDAARPPGDGVGLTLRQLEVLALLCQGLSNKEIGRQLELAEQTVKVHVGAIFKALQVVNRTQAVIAARRLGIAGA